EARRSVDDTMQAFMAEVLPKATRATRTLAIELVTSTLGALGEQYSRAPRTPSDIKVYANAVADMLGAYLTLQDRR
ncbi:MAG: TetR/AcrR family transcriptional regulator, partial [Luteibacter sp.]